MSKIGLGNIFSSRRSSTIIRKNEEINNSLENEEEAPVGSGYFIQFLAGMSIYLSIANHGIQSAWTSPALPYLSNRTTDFTLSDEEGAWIASVPSFGMMFGVLISPLLLDRKGRKYTFMVYAIPNILSWILIILAKDYLTLWIGRFIGGIGAGGAYSVSVVYFAEIASKEIRGILISILNVASNLGTLYVVTIGAFFTYETMNIFMILIPILSIFMIPFMLKTPYFHLIKNQEEEALKILMKLRQVKNPERLRLEIERMKNSVEESRNSKKNSLEEFFDRGNRIGLLILLFSTAATFLSGLAVIEAFSEDIFSHSDFFLSPKYATIVLGVVRTISGLASTLFVDRARKMMFLLSGILSSLALASVGLFFFLDSLPGYDASSFSWLPLAGLISYLIFTNMGLTSIPMIYMGELFSINAKGAAVALSIIFASVFSTISKFEFQGLKSSFGMHVPFWSFAICCIIFTFVVHLFSPDTAGKNLEEVQNILKQKKKNSNSNSDELEFGSTST